MYTQNAQCKSTFKNKQSSLPGIRLPFLSANANINNNINHSSTR